MTHQRAAEQYHGGAAIPMSEGHSSVGSQRQPRILPVLICINLVRGS